MKIKKLGVLLFLGAIITGFTACGGKGNTGSTSSGAKSSANTNSVTSTNSVVSTKSTTSEDKEISIGVTPVPHQEIVKGVVVPILEKEGYKVKVVEFNDYVQPNTSVEEGEIDANYYQTTNYLENENKERNLHLVSVAEVHLEPMGFYSKKVKDKSEIKNATIAIPNDASNGSRALVLLAENGLIKLKETNGLYKVSDISENPNNIEIKEVEAALLPQVLSDVEGAVINSNYAIPAGLTLSDALFHEDPKSSTISQYFNDLVVKSGNENSEKIQALKKAITSDEVKKFIEEKYKGAVLPAF